MMQSSIKDLLKAVPVVTYFLTGRVFDLDRFTNDIAHPFTYTKKEMDTTESLLIFGDGLSDDGNLFAVTRKKEPSSNLYYNGRFSDGPVWPEYLRNYTQAPSYGNFAIGGATAVTFNGNDTVGNNGGGLKAQIAQFKSWSARKKPFKPEKAQAIIWLGSGDLMKSPAIDETRVFTSLREGIEDLINNHKIQHFFLPTLISPDNEQVEFTGLMSKMTRELNKKYGKLGVEVVAWSLLDDLITDLVTDGVLSDGVTYNTFYDTLGPDWRDKLSECLQEFTPTREKRKMSLSCADTMNRILVNGAYPNTRLHMGIAQLMFKAIPPIIQPQNI